VTSDRDETVLRGLLTEAAQDAWQGPDLQAVARRGEQRERSRRTARRAAGAALAAGAVLVVGRTGAAAPARSGAAAVRDGAVGGAVPAWAASALVVLALAAATAGVGLLAVRLARQLGRAPRRAGGAVLAALLAVAFLGATSQVAVRAEPVQSEAMDPSLRVGQHVLVAVRVPGLTKVRRGDVVLVRAPSSWVPNPGTLLLKRVVGLPGETVACCDPQGRITVDGRPLDEPYLARDVAPSEVGFSHDVAPGGLFLVGDARSISADSRQHLAPGEADVPVDDVVAVVLTALP
jgi:signal peptidase I